MKRSIFLLPFALLFLLPAARALPPGGVAGMKLPPAAQISAAESAYRLGTDYEAGRGVPKNLRLALDWYRKAGNYPKALGKIGWFSEQGLGGMPRNDAVAAKYYLRAAQAGDVAVASNLGLLFATGRGVPVSAKDAIYWYTKSVADNNENGMYNYGVLYVEGKALPIDYAKASGWFNRALVRAEQTHNRQIIYAARYNLRSIALRQGKTLQPKRSQGVCSDTYVQRHSRNLLDLFGRSFTCAMHDKRAWQYHAPTCAQSCQMRCSNIGGDRDRMICANSCMSNCN